ncbi:hypothetical protein [uncultured Draconibacterium sp.]|uniref:hypothetical protein n=1 Tax=uncultured Draconibacterium sp. TaxID=1573823 RepID=UPI002AA8DD96|nr:hypothetical protein [uncultured Draconibacterium sp.]
MKARFRNNQPSILILADFSDGSWHAASFAIQFLNKNKSPISILQTYQSPGLGHFTMRNLSHHLKKITQKELGALKNRLLKHFKTEEQPINTFSIEGELNSVLKYMPNMKGQYNLVLSTHNSFEDSCRRQNGCLEKIINTAKNPLFILPKTFEGETSKKILFVGNPNQKPSEQLYSQVIEICRKTNSNLEVLFVVKASSENVSKDIKTYYTDYINEIDIAFNTAESRTKCKGISKYLNKTSRDLIVIENEKSGLMNN